MLFSVIIPTFNRAQLLDETLRSVERQRFADFEVIVVDDGSTDATSEVLQAHGARVRSLRQDRGGPGAARNLGARSARGRYLAFLDSDDLWFPWTLETYASAIEQHGAPAFVTGTPSYFTDPAELPTVHAESPMRLQPYSDYYASSDEWRWWGASAFVVRRDCFEAAGGFVEARINGEDADLAMRLGTQPGYVQVTAPATFGYRRHAASEMANFSSTIDGAWYVLDAERHDRYPGDAARAVARRRIIGRHIRSVMLQAVRSHRGRDAWRLYRATFAWHLRLRHWRFLAWFPLLAVSTRLSEGNTQKSA